MFKINRLSFLFTFLVLGFLAQSCHTKTSSRASTSFEPIPNEKSLLWEVSGNGLKKTSYIYGTIHLIPKADFFITKKTLAALQQAEKVTFEINMKDMNNPLALFGILSKTMMPNGKRLREFISEEDYTLVKAKCDSLGLPLSMMERVKPIFISIMLDSGGESMQTMGKKESKTTGYEMEFQKIAEKQKKEFGGLETIEFQMGIFDSIPLVVQAEMLVKSVKKTSENGNELAELIKIYKTQDIDAMSRLALSGEESGSEPEMQNFERIILSKRNRAWIPKMMKQMNEKSTFFAVGAAHLGGNEGVLNLLRQRGYTVLPLK